MAYLSLAFPNGKGKWNIVGAEADIVDGYYHKLAFPGFETRSGSGFGITATVYAVDDEVFWENGRLFGTIRRLVLQNGRLCSSEVVGEREEIVQFASHSQGHDAFFR
jgi:hypothetical protein